MGDAIKGAFVGALLGGLAGFSAFYWLLGEAILFPGDTMLFGAAACGTAGFLWGGDFFDWLGEHWPWLV